MKAVEAYVGDSNFKWVNLDKDVQVLHAENLNFPHLLGVARTSKLQEKLDKQKEKYPNAVGYIDGKVIAITLFDDNTWTGRIWSARQTISGKYTRM